MQKVSFKEINILAVPAIFAGIVEPLISLTDSAVAGNLTQNPEEALGAVGLVGSVVSALVWVFAQSANAISSIVSQAVGNQSLNKEKPLVSQLFVLNLLVGFAVATLMYCLAKPIFELYGAKGRMLQYSIDYFKIRIWAFPFAMVLYMLYGVFRGLQNTRWAMQIALVGGSTNILLDLLLVFVFDFHVLAIAYASLVAQIIMFALAIYVLLKKTPFQLNAILPKHPKMKLILGMSGNLALRAVSLNIAILISYFLATSYGSIYIDTQTLLVQIWLFSAFLLDGYAAAGNAISGKLLGQKNWQKLQLLTNDLTRIMLKVGLGLSLVYTLLYYPIGRVFTYSNTILPLFYATFWMVILMQPINSLAFLYDGIYKGMGKTKVLRNLLAVATFLGFVPTVFFLDFFNFKLYGIWIAFFVWMLIRTFGLMLNFRKNFHRL